MEGSFFMAYNSMKPFLVVVLMQLGYAGMAVIGKVALDHGMSHYTLVVYRHAIAAVAILPFALVLERKVRPRMTTSTFIKILLLGLFEPVIDQNLYYMGMKQTSATFTAAMCNIIPAVAFVMSWALRLEKVNLRRLQGQAKVAGTAAAVGGAMLMTMIKGPALHLAWTSTYHQQPSAAAAAAAAHQNPVMGSLMIAVGCICWASFVVLQAVTLKSYPAELSLTAWICVAGAVEGTILTLAVERGNLAIWSLNSHSTIVAVLYGGILISGVGYFAQGVILREKGPVFVTAFNPLCMIFVAIMGSFLLSEQIFLGRVIGAVVIVAGLYMVVWGKSKDEVPCELTGNPPATPDKQSAAKLDNDGDFISVDVEKIAPKNEGV